jgi:plasmid stabilization system protein ParE
MGLDIYWTWLAKKNMQEVRFYYEKEAGRTATRKMITELKQKITNLSESPKIGQVESMLEHRLQEYRYIVYKNYKIIYFVNEVKNRIDIVNIFDCRQNPIKISIL